MAPRTDSRERMLASAAELFHVKGYHATGLNELVSVANAPKGSLYFHFPGGKEQLAVEALRRSGGELGDRLALVLEGTPDPGDAVAAVVESLATALAESGFQRGCPLATVALDAADGSEPIRQACASGYQQWQRLISDSLAAYGIAPERAEQLGVIVLAAIEGALLLAKTHRDTAPLHAVADHLRTTIEKETGR